MVFVLDLRYLIDLICLFEISSCAALPYHAWRQNDLSTQRGIELHSDNTDLSVIVQLDGEGLLHVNGKRHEPATLT